MKGSKTIGMLSLMMFLLTCAYLPADTDAEREGIGRGMEITTQFFGGYLGGAAGGISLGIIGVVLYAVWVPSSSELDFGPLVIGFPLGATPGMILASSGSVYGIGQAWGHRNGSFGKTLLGASVPPLLGAAVGGIYAVREEGPQAIPICLLFGAFLGSFYSPVGAIAGYHLSAQPNKSAATLHGHQSTLRRNLSDCQNKEPFTFYVLRFKINNQSCEHSEAISAEYRMYAKHRGRYP